MIARSTMSPTIVSTGVSMLLDIQSLSTSTARANSLLICTLTPVNPPDIIFTSDGLLIPSVAALAGRVDHDMGILSPPSDMSTLVLEEDDRRDWSRCFASSVIVVKDGFKTNSMAHDLLTYCVHDAAGKFCPVKLIPRCEECLIQVLQS
jgi:hypothetical protein